MNRLGHFLRRISNPSGRLAGCVFKSVGTPGGVAFSKSVGTPSGVAFSNPSGRLAGCVFESVGTPAVSGLVLEAVDRGRDSAYTVHEI